MQEMVMVRVRISVSIQETLGFHRPRLALLSANIFKTCLLKQFFQEIYIFKSTVIAHSSTDRRLCGKGTSLLYHYFSFDLHVLSVLDFASLGNDVDLVFSKDVCDYVMPMCRICWSMKLWHVISWILLTLEELYNIISDLRKRSKKMARKNWIFFHLFMYLLFLPLYNAQPNLTVASKWTKIIIHTQAEKYAEYRITKTNKFKIRWILKACCRVHFTQLSLKLFIIDLTSPRG